MDTPVLITAIGVALVLLGGAISAVMTGRRQQARKILKPSRHRGDFQSQKNRVYSNSKNSHNANPTSPG